jgi:manganese/zinc/iron transport system substrate-binding protein
MLMTLLSFLILAGCSSASHRSEDRGEDKLRVVATTTIVADLVANIGGERVRVTSLMGSGVDPHLYKASEGDIGRLANADVIFYNGLHLEAKMSEVLERLQDRKHTVAITDAIDRALLLSPPEFAGAYDPHLWFDVSLWARTIDHVHDHLVRADPQGEATYRNNAEQYRERLRELDEYVRSQSARIPEEQRVLITAHDAFNYFGRAYGFEVRGLQGISTMAEAGVADVRSLARFAVERRVRAMFVESSVPTRTIEAVQAAVRAQGFAIEIGGQLFSDALGDAGTPAASYEGMTRHNINTIVSALLGQQS